MARRSNRRRSELTESWADVSSDDVLSDHSSASDSEREERPKAIHRSTPRLQSRPQRSSPAPPTSSSRYADSPRQRTTRSTRNSVEPELIMPSMHGSSLQSSTPKRSPRQSPNTSAKKPTPKRARESFMAEPEYDEEGQGMWTAVMGYCASTFGQSMLWLQPLFGLALAAVILGFVVFVGRSYVMSRITSLVTGWSPMNAVCSVPVISMLPFCPTWMPKGPPEFDRLVNVQSKFDDVMAVTAEYGSLPLDMKRSEASIRDLKHVVRHSDLPSRQELVFEFEGFIDTAKEASLDLTRFNAQTGHAIDRILSINRWTLRVIDGVATREVSHGAVSRFFQQTLPGAVGFHVSTLDEVLLNQYLIHTSQVEDQIATLIIKAQALLGVLNNLDGRLDLIADIVTRDGVSVSRNKDELFSFLWTKLGGNRDSVKKIKDQLTLLNDVNRYRKVAYDHVSAALLKLMDIQAGLEDLRERVAVAETVGLVIPLEQHLENVKLGVERLEGIRDEQRGKENKIWRNALGSGAPDEGRILDDPRVVQGRISR